MDYDGVDQDLSDLTISESVAKSWKLISNWDSHMAIGHIYIIFSLFAHNLYSIPYIEVGLETTFRYEASENHKQ